jgi:hypothetical protein
VTALGQVWTLKYPNKWKALPSQVTEPTDHGAQNLLDVVPAIQFGTRYDYEWLL